MVEIKCSSLGYDCKWTYRDSSEYVLLDIVGMHLREAHDVKEVDLDMLGKIRTSFTFPDASDAAAKIDVIMNKYNCEGDPDCSDRYKETIENLMTTKSQVQKKAA